MTAHAERDGRTTLARLRPYWCDDCGRAHDGTREDAHTTLGERGVTMTGHAYAWCVRCDAYHVTSPQRRMLADRVTRAMLAERPFGRERGTGRTHVKARGRTSRRTLRVRSLWAVTRHATPAVARTASHARAAALLAGGAGL